MYQLKYILLFPLLLISYWCAAQVYPVHGTVILTPPYSVYLPDYAAEGQLRLLLQQRDLSQASYLLTIRMDLKLNGRSIMRTSPNYRPAPFSIAPGNPVALTGADLLPYLDARNIDFSGYSRSEYERTKSLPEGSYTLCFTAYDYRRPEVAVSSATCGFYYLAKAEPPLINLPQCGTLIPSQGAMSVLFQWMPRNTSSLNSAMNTTYRFELFEVRPEGANPKAVVANSRPIFTEDIDQTQFFYNSTHPYLTHGMQYAWRVQAIDRSGRDAFRNKGYSEVCYFTFGGSPHTIDPLQKAPQGLQAKALTPQRGGAFWNKGNFDSYRFYFRKVGPNYEWFPREVRDTSLVFGELVPQIEYECRVQGKRGEFYGPYSDIVRFVAPEQPAPVACLDTTDYSKRPKGDPLATLAVGDKVDTHGFLLKINTLQSLGGGWYKGTGLITIPFLNNIGVKVFFDRMYVNTLYQNTDGEIKAVSRPRTQWVKDKLGSQGIVTKGTIKTDTQPDFTINLQGAPPVIRDGQGQVINAQNPPKINENGIAEGPFTISVLDDKGSVKEVKVDQLPATLRDASGAVYQVNTDGKVTKVGQELAPEEQFTEEQLTNAISFGDGRVQFRQADGYALDTMKNMYNEKKVFHQVFTELGYEYITRWGGATRTVFDEFKAMEAGKPARVTAVFKLTNLTTGRRRPDMLRFVTGHNVRLFPIDSVVHHISEKTALISYTLEIPAGEEKDGLNIYAMLRTHPDKAHCIGKLTALSYRPQHLEVVMVYVGKTANKINLTDIQAKLDKIYNPIGVYIKVKDDRNFNPDPKWDINSDNKLNVLGSGAFSTLTPEMKALNASYRATPQYNSKQAVLFVLEKSDSTNIAGDMPRGEQFGYIFADALKNVDVGWLVAHELGHGLFTLQHSWKNNGESSEGKTDNLMDYNKGTSLSKYQWDLIHNPENVWDWLKRDQESMYAENAHRGLTPNGQLIDHFYLNGESILPAIHVDQYVIKAITHQTLEYTWDNTSHTYVNPSQKDAICPKKTAAYKQVNVYTKGENCNYKYLVIPWSDTDEKLNNSTQVVNLVSERTDNKTWLLADLSSPECAKRFRESYFSTHAISKAYVDYFKSKSLKISEKLSENNELIASLVDLVKQQSENSKDVKFLGDILADKLRTYELFNSKKFIVVPLLIHTLSTNQSEWHTLADRVFQEAGLADDAILITVPYVNCPGIGGDLGQNYYMPGLAFGRNVNVNLPSLKKDHSNTEKNITLSKPVASFILDVFTHTTKKALIYKGTYLATNAIECIVYKSEAVSGYAFNKAIQLYRQKDYANLAKLIADGEARYKRAKDGMVTQGMAPSVLAPSQNEMNKTLALIEYRNKQVRLNTIQQLSTKISEDDLERYQPSKLDWIDFKEEFLDAPNANAKLGATEERANGFYYVLNRPFRKLQDSLKYPSSATVDWKSEHAFTNRTDFHLAYYVDRPLYAGLDVASVGLSVVGFDFIPDLLGVAYSTFRGNYTNTVAYGLSVFIVVGSAPMVKQLIHNGKPLVSVARDGTVLFVDDVSDIVLREFLQTHKASFTTKAFAQLEQKSGAELKKGIELALKSYDDLAELLQKQLGSDVLVKQFQRDFGSNMDRFVEVASNKELVQSWLILEKSGTSHFTKFNLTYLQRFSRLSPEVQTYIAKFTDPMDGKGTLVKFLDDCDDDFIRYLNDPENALQVRGFLAHKPSVLDIGDQDLIARMLYDPSEVLDPKVRKWLEYGNNMEIFRKARAAGLAAEKAIRTELADPNSPAYKALKGVVSDLDQRTIISQAQLCITADCIEKGGYFIPDFIAVIEKVDADNFKYLDVIIIDAKLGGNTGWTVNQNAAKKMGSFVIKSPGTDVIKGIRPENFMKGGSVSKSTDFIKISPIGGTYIVKQ